MESSLCQDVVLPLLRQREPLFGYWRVQEVIGSGAFGCVYRIARQDSPAKFVSALKVIPVIAGTTHDHIEGKGLSRIVSEYSREIRALYELSHHPNAVGLQNFQTLRYNEAAGNPTLLCIMMDYMPHVLKDDLDAGSLSAAAGLHILTGCLCGLEHVHDHGVIHRDIKPDNIFIDDKGNALIGDFGIATPIMVPAKARNIAGTPMYMAPEVYRDLRGKGFSTSADLYALGLVAYRMFHGYMPFGDLTPSPAEAVRRRMDGGAFFCREGLPDGMAEALSTALAFDPGARFATAGIFRQALEKILKCLTADQAGALCPKPYSNISLEGKGETIAEGPWENTRTLIETKDI